MREIGSFEAKTHLAQLLDSVAGGAEVVITRRGKPVARLVPFAEDVHARRTEAVARIASLRADMAARGQGMATDEILSARDSGRR